MEATWRGVSRSTISSRAASLHLSPTITKVDEMAARAGA